MKRPRKPVVVDPQVVEADERTKALVLEQKGIGAWLKVSHITDDAHMTKASAILAWTKEHIDKAEKERRELTQPLNAVVRKINARFKEVTEPAEKVQARVNYLMREYVALLHAKAEASVEKEAAKHEALGENEFAMDLRENALREKPELDLQGVAQRDTWQAEVVDLNAALVALMEGDKILAAAREDIVNAIRKVASKVAVGVRSPEIGVPGCKGVRVTTFVRKA